MVYVRDTYLKIIVVMVSPYILLLLLLKSRSKERLPIWNYMARRIN
jgi:hypothetical protein